MNNPITDDCFLILKEGIGKAMKVKEMEKFMLLKYWKFEFKTTGYTVQHLHSHW